MSQDAPQSPSSAQTRPSVSGAKDSKKKKMEMGKEECYSLLQQSQGELHEVQLRYYKDASIHVKVMCESITTAAKKVTEVGDAVLAFINEKRGSSSD